jgi:FkbM family methyltransferase
VITQTREVAIGGIMLDLGGNNGRMAVPRAVLGDATAVYCAEPEPLNYACLVRNVSGNHLGGLVMPDWVAIGSRNGTVSLERARTAGGHRVIDAGRVSKLETVEVPGYTLDTWVERLGIDLEDVTFVKVDVQGSELHVLEGASRVLACKHIAWQMEIDAPLLARRGVALDALYGMLAGHFTHFVDLSKHVATPRLQPIADMTARLAYVGGGKDGRTDVLLFSLA